MYIVVSPFNRKYINYTKVILMTFAVGISAVGHMGAVLVQTEGWIQTSHPHTHTRTHKKYTQDRNLAT